MEAGSHYLSICLPGRASANGARKSKARWHPFHSKAVLLERAEGTFGDHLPPDDRPTRRSVNLDAPEIHSGDPHDARLAFEEAAKLRGIWHPLFIAQPKERSTDAMECAAIEHELAF